MTDTARNAMLETITHMLVSLAVIGAATTLCALHAIDGATWVGAIGAGIGLSGGISVLQNRASNGKVVGESAALVQLPGGRRYTDPPPPDPSSVYEGQDSEAAA